MTCILQYICCVLWRLSPDYVFIAYLQLLLRLATPAVSGDDGSVLFTVSLFQPTRTAGDLRSRRTAYVCVVWLMVATLHSGSSSPCSGLARVGASLDLWAAYVKQLMSRRPINLLTPISSPMVTRPTSPTAAGRSQALMVPDDSQPFPADPAASPAAAAAAESAVAGLWCSAAAAPQHVAVSAVISAILSCSANWPLALSTLLLRLWSGQGDRRLLQWMRQPLLHSLLSFGRRLR